MGALNATKKKKQNVAIDFGASSVTKNNLGDQGPKKKGGHRLIFKGVGKVDDKSFDLVVTADSNYFKSMKPKVENGLAGHLGTVNFEWGSKSVLTFSFQDSDTKEPVE